MGSVNLAANASFNSVARSRSPVTGLLAASKMTGDIDVFFTYTLKKRLVTFRVRSELFSKFTDIQEVAVRRDGLEDSTITFNSWHLNITSLF